MSMSSFAVPNYSYPDRAPASSPELGPRRAEAPQRPEDISVRPMRLKVLYTFDDQNKTNCLARWPQVLDIRTAFLDESTQIGVIELKTCIQAIVSASPELVAKLGQEYTVYAYDYSEYETPLVGQGMLSWVLASSSAMPSASTTLSRPVVTGRVCKNILGLFSSSSQETLEVKLRLIPVPNCLQSEYMESMRKYRDLSRIMPPGFDSGAWMTFLQANPAMTQLASQSRCGSPATVPGQNEAMGLEHMQRLLGEGLNSNYMGEQHSNFQGGNYQMAETNEKFARTASPASSTQCSTAPLKRRGRPPRTTSRTSARGPDIKPKQVMGSQAVENTLPASDDRSEDGPAKKRAKVSKADWSGNAGIGKQAESLRVAASTAASVRIHQPTAVRPLMHDANSLEGPPRAPTPIADPTNSMRRPPLPVAGSSLRRESLTAESLSYESPYPVSEAVSKPPESATSSPENSRVGSLSNTPMDIASSPPIYRGVSTAPSSPNLPILPRHADSGFMNSSIDDLFEDDELQPHDDEEAQVVGQYSQRPELLIAVSEQNESPQTAPIASIPQVLDQPDAKAIARSRTAARNATGSRLLDRANSLENLPAPANAKSDFVQTTALHRSQTWSSQQPQHAASDTAIMSGGAEGSMGSLSGSRSGSGASGKRKKAIQSKLELSIAAGEMPPFCENCGAIETPTWRKAWVKVHSGTPEHVKISEEEGGIVAWQPLKTDSEGNINLYRIVKKALLAADEGFTEILLCNPCGLWLHTRKCMRPREIWEKPQRDPDEKRKRAPRAKKSKRGSMPDEATSEPPLEVTMQSDASSPANDTKPKNNVEEAFQLPQITIRRALSEQGNTENMNNLKDLSTATALHRAVQSSPTRFMGTEHVPIVVDDLTPKPIRRVLFPSPQQAEAQHAATEQKSNCDSKNHEVNLSSVDSSLQEEDAQADKENCPPPPAQDHFCRVFEYNQLLTSRPTTPTPSNELTLNHFKTAKTLRTPDRNLPTGDFLTSAAKATILPITPKRTPTNPRAQPLVELSPFTVQLNQLFSDSSNGSRSDHFEFTSLPSFEMGNVMDMDFSQFEGQDFFSTDGPMPSSSPRWFGVYEDPVEKRPSI